MMPPGGNDARAKAIAELATLHHERLTAPDMGDLLHDAETRESYPALQRSILEMKRVWQQAVCLPADLVKAKSLAGSKCEHGWRTQRRENDWPGFLENFREVVRLSREEAQARRAAAPDRFATPYDALLDSYEPGGSSAAIDALFDDLAAFHVVFGKSLLDEVLGRQAEPAVDLAGDYPIEAQEAVCRRLMTQLGFDFEAGRLDVSMHPFSTGGRGDHRITTRFRETDFVDALMATAHETGHAAYESGLPEAWEGLPAGQARSMSLHESQSLFFEKHLYLCRSFIDFFTGILHESLSGTKRFTAGQIWSESIRVRPRLIRIEADEVTYPLHVILRFEIESGLIDGSLEAEDIPDVWDRKMQAYLGLSTHGNDRDGCMQDIHWTDGAFGYFPSYTLGALNAAQLAGAIGRAHPDWQSRLGSGEVGFIRDWLEKNVWRKGSLVDTQEILRTATGEATNPEHFLAHLRARYFEQAY